MKKIKFTIWMLVASIFVAGFATSCGDDNKDDNGNVNLTELTELVSTCESALNGATTDDYPQSAITSFKSTLDGVKDAISKGQVKSQATLNNLLTQLKNALKTFQESAYDAVTEAQTIFKLSFDEGTGTSLKTTGSYEWTATLEKGPSEIFGSDTQLPTFVDGHKGKAIYLKNGAHLEIADYQALPLEGSKLSIAAWIKPEETRADNYVISYNYWKSWKLNIQTENKPFFTVATAAGTTDMDNETPQSVPNGSWTHVAVTMDLTAGSVKFYINGELTKEWTKDNHANLTGTVNTYSSSVGKLPIFIGTGTSYAEAKAAWDWEWKETPEAWSWMFGSIDELGVYNVALTAGQVAKLAAE